MEKRHENIEETKIMLADYMENGFLENIMDMYLHAPSLYDLVGDLIRDERVRVRVGFTALIEELSKKDSENVVRAIPGLLPLLKDDLAVVRGDAANLLGVIGNIAATAGLEAALYDEDPSVRLIAEEALANIKA